MTIIACKQNLDKKTIYKLANNASSSKMIDHDGEEIEIAAWAICDTEKVDRKTGETETKRVLYIQNDKNDIFGSVSPTFIEAFSDIYETFGEDFHRIKVVKGTSKNGREFVTCNLVD